MPMRLRAGRREKRELSPEQIDFFLTGTDFTFFWDEPERGNDWRAVRDDLLRDWIQEHPGTRPAAWWKYDAPKQAAPKVPKWHRGEMVEPRRRIGGAGAPSWEQFPAILPYYRFGIPVSFEGIDKADPPTFESEATYLKRNGLLSPGEERRIPPEAWEPEAVR
jgi:hypothetical protein